MSTGSVATGLREIGSIRVAFDTTSTWSGSVATVAVRRRPRR
jgi:hypothetical protein